MDSKPLFESNGDVQQTMKKSKVEDIDNEAGLQPFATFNDFSEVVAGICAELAPLKLRDRVKAFGFRDLARFCRVSRRVRDAGRPELYRFVNLSDPKSKQDLLPVLRDDPALQGFIRQLLVTKELTDDAACLTGLSDLEELICERWSAIDLAPKTLTSLHLRPRISAGGYHDSAPKKTFPWLFCDWHERFPSLRELAIPEVGWHVKGLKKDFKSKLARLLSFSRFIVTCDLDENPGWPGNYDELPEELSPDDVVPLVPAQTKYLDLSRNRLSFPSVTGYGNGRWGQFPHNDLAATLTALSVSQLNMDRFADFRGLRSLRSLRIITTYPSPDFDYEAPYRDFEAMLPMASIERFVIGLLKTDKTSTTGPNAVKVNVELAKLVQKHCTRRGARPLVRVEASRRLMDIADPSTGAYYDGTEVVDVGEDCLPPNPAYLLPGACARNGIPFESKSKDACEDFFAASFLWKDPPTPVHWFEHRLSEFEYDDEDDLRRSCNRRHHGDKEEEFDDDY